MAATYLAALSVFVLALGGKTSAATSPEEVFSHQFLGRLPEGRRVKAALTTRVQVVDERRDVEDLNGTLEELRNIFGNAFAAGVEDNFREIREMLMSVVAASPKNANGRLDDGPARYALRRVFMERNGWHLPSLGEDEVEEQEIDVSNPTLTLGYSLPFSLRQIIQKRIANRGAGLLDLSIFVASLEQMEAQMVPKRLESAFRLMLLDFDATVDVASVQEIIDLYMAGWICGEDLTRMSVGERFKFQADVPFIYNQWSDAKRLFREVQRSAAPDLMRFNFSTVLDIVRRIETEFPFWNNRQCATLKRNMMRMEVQASGRLRLLDFYDGALHKGMVQFRETRKYLKALGAIDESDPLEPRVIISNYLDGPSNCVGETKHYSLCCIDECGDLYGHIEREVGKPEASPEVLISIVRHLASSTMQRARLSKAILKRIHQIAAHHDGFVPLHSPLFAEWMHFAYPRECTHMQMFGQAHRLTLSQWESQGGPAGLTDAELRVSVKELENLEFQRLARANASNDDDEASTCWTWDKADINVTFEDEDDTDSHQLEQDGRLSSRWIATILFVSCVAIYVLKLFKRSEPPKGV
eukprot:TRINITY_DN1002_c0_g1_i1.p1 TRINITY_DN1002_c0_g1~~TRINITY_DN1002_c0_g1_i1.p1  ORF type:complete len:606 (+),score=104.23 TRINITY_DN1002_c0_g1_i1:69-1820(+)